MKRVHVHVTGRVQGVFFRAECERVAREHGVAGFVRNLPDGRVEAAFEGNDTDVDACVAWCREGSSWARVEDVDATEEAPTGDQQFGVR